jgi:hypothetical protein
LIRQFGAPGFRFFFLSFFLSFFPESEAEIKKRRLAQKRKKKKKKKRMKTKDESKGRSNWGGAKGGWGRGVCAECTRVFCLFFLFRVVVTDRDSFFPPPFNSASFFCEGALDTDLKCKK